MQLTNALKEVPGLPGPSSEATNSKFVEQYMTGELRQVCVFVHASVTWS